MRFKPKNNSGPNEENVTGYGPKRGKKYPQFFLPCFAQTTVINGPKNPKSSEQPSLRPAEMVEEKYSLLGETTWTTWFVRVLNHNQC